MEWPPKTQTSSERSVPHYCLKCKLKIESMIIESVVKADTGERFYAIGTCPHCLLKQKRPLRRDIALEILGGGNEVVNTDTSSEGKSG